MRSRFSLVASALALIAASWAVLADGGSSEAPDVGDDGVNAFPIATSTTVSTDDTTLRAGIPANLIGGWTVRSFDGQPITWDPRTPIAINFVMGPPGVIAFAEDGCSDTRYQVAFDGRTMTVNRGSVSRIEGSCIAELGYERPPIGSLLSEGRGVLDYALEDGVLTLHNPDTGVHLAAEREATIHEPLPPDLVIPNSLYGSWRVDSWTDAEGRHDVVPPDPFLGVVRFMETPLGPVVAFQADCNGTTVEIDDVSSGVIHLSGPGMSTLIGCGPGSWSLPALTSVISGDEVLYEVRGDRLVLRSSTNAISLTATQISDR